MGAIEDVVGDAANFIGPLLGKGSNTRDGEDNVKYLLDGALFHLRAIHNAEKTAGPDAPYDGSLVGVVYGLIDLVTSLGVLPRLSQGVAIKQRPQSVLVATISIPSEHDQKALWDVIESLKPILEDEGAGIQPLISQRALPDIVSALAELSFSPATDDGVHGKYKPFYEKILSSTPVSRLLPILTSFLQHGVPPWWKPLLSKELSSIPLRTHGVRHVVEFLSLSYLSKNSQVPQDASGPQKQIPLPLEAITQATRLITAVPSDMSQDDWFRRLAPQLLDLLDGKEGKELSRAAGQIIAGGILTKKSTGAPEAIGWNLFARPLQQAIFPKAASAGSARQGISEQVLVSEQEFRLALRRLASIVSSYAHAGLLKRLVAPLLFPLWGLLNYTSTRPSLEKEWSELAHAIFLRYLTIACDPLRVESIANDLFWDGSKLWTFLPGSEGGIEIRQRIDDGGNTLGVEGILSKIESLDRRINLLVSLIVEAKLDDQMAGTIFLQAIKKWLVPSHDQKSSLTDEPDTDPLLVLANAKFAQALATKFEEKLARSPHHIIELANQLLRDYVEEHRTRSKKAKNIGRPSRAALRNLVQPAQGSSEARKDSEGDDIVSFALSIVNTLIASKDFKRSSETTEVLNAMLPSLQYLSKPQATPISPVISNAASNALHIIEPSLVRAPTPSADPRVEHRETLRSAIAELTSPEPPNQAWALSTIRKLIKDPIAFPVIDVPSLTHAILSASIADRDSYVYTAAIPALVELAVRAPNPTVRIVVDAFTDVDERSLRLKKEKEIQEALDYRLRVGEILNNLVLEESFWHSSPTWTANSSLKLMIEASLSLASRRGQRKKTLSKRNELLELEVKQQQEGEEAWGGPIPNLLDPDADNPAEQAERDALLKIIHGWEETGIEEDVRIRASALSILSSMFEKRIELMSQATVDAGLQMALLILTVETGEAKGILRRAAVMVVMGLLRGMDAMLEDDKQSAAGMGPKQIEEVERVIRWVRSEDVDGLVRDHAENVIEGLETWRMKQLYKIRDESMKLGPDLGLAGNLRGLNVQPLQDDEAKRPRGRIVEEIE